MRSPAETVGESACLRMEIGRESTRVTAGGVIGLASLEVFTLAVLVTVPEPVAQLAGVSVVVGLEMWTETVAPEVRSVPGPPKCRAPPEIVQAGSAGLTVQTRSVLVGSVSLSVTSWAVPGPLLWTVTV